MHPLDEFWRELGHFIFIFARTEKALYFNLLISSGMRWNAAKSMFTDGKIDVIKTRIKKLKEAHGVKDTKILYDALDQLSTITSMRNDICHYGLQPNDDNSFTMDNSDWKLKDSTKYKIKKEDLTNAIADLNKIQAIVGFDMFGATDMINDQTILGLSRPWQHKSFQPIRPPSSNRPKSEEPKLQRPSSRQKREKAMKS